ncbi:MAG: MBL fold metallo-hydrolase [Acutalibacter sp.]|jgi:L-ascorbate metabolism protein UlaG (beta-lactamase superfamily)|uniref:MBL fold metallo-hydrolase n=1 Tax=Acutalibacter sp. TaxID=1918636 RepID=UPI00217276D6|nr:MBL fold metallo-hydrolase [Acutalibacter sp.]MCI9224607.1 MBL fold metallo-hydrolase [Acutalibacter sp.]
MKVTFILHSGYFVELDSCCLLFDYYQGEIPRSQKPLYVFASHHHEDHFSPEVFKEARPGRQVHFILSNDIFQSRVPEELREAALFVKPYETYELEGLRLATLKSTDDGVAFLIECESRRFYHAGDLNCWVWEGAPKWQNDQMKEAYKNELKLLEGKAIDVAFVPLDPRQDADFDLGMRYFFEAAGAEHVFPMHMWGDYTVVPLFKSTPTYREYAPRVMDVKEPGQVFEI